MSSDTAKARLILGARSAGHADPMRNNLALIYQDQGKYAQVEPSVSPRSWSRARAGRGAFPNADCLGIRADCTCITEGDATIVSKGFPFGSAVVLWN